MSKVQVLVVDENREHLEWMVSHLGTFNYEIHHASSGDEAYWFLFQNPTTHLLILSSNLPDISALALLNKIKDAIGVPHTIILGKSLQAPKAIELMRAGASDVLKFPFHEAELIVAVKQAFEAQSLIEQLNRERDLNIENEIGIRIRAFQQFLSEANEKGRRITPQEIMMFFPKIKVTPELSTEEIVQIVGSGAYDSFLTKLPKPVLLTVDDENHITAGIKQLLHSEFTVLTAASGYEAYDILSAKSPRIDMMLLDIGMPKKSGDMWVSDYRDYDPELIIMMLTAFKKDIDLIVNTIRAGASDYITKPFQPKKLIDKISKIVRQKLIKDHLTQWIGTKHCRILGSSTATIKRKFE